MSQWVHVCSIVHHVLYNDLVQVVDTGLILYIIIQSKCIFYSLVHRTYFTKVIIKLR